MKDMAVTTRRVAARQQGFSIVELMVAMAISLLLLSGVIAIFSSSRASYEATEKISRIQESGRFAVDQLVYDIRSAGFPGCSKVPTYLSSTLDNSAQLQWDFIGGPIRGFQYSAPNTWIPALDTSIKTPAELKSPADGSDVLVVRVPRRDIVPQRLTAPMATGASDIVLSAAAAGILRANDTMQVYSCEAQAFFQARSVTGGVITHGPGGGVAGKYPGNLTDDINYPFRENAEVVPVDTVIYYVRQSGSAFAGIGPADVNSLWRKVGMDAAQELVEGVEQMQLEFGRDADGDGVIEAYVRADEVAANKWGDIIGVRVALLVRSMEETARDTDRRQYFLLTGVNQVVVNPPGDRHLREVFSAASVLRNRASIN